MEFRRPKILLEHLGLIRGTQNKISDKCRDSEQIKVIQDSSSKIIYLDWEKNFKHSINYDNTRKDKIVFHYEDYLNTSKRINQVLPFVGTKKVLDYGCGKGSFIKELSKIIGKERCLGLEKSIIARENLEAKGIKTFNKIKEINQEISLITCFHVLEHLDRPEDFLKKSHDILEENSGYLIIEVPHANDPLIALYNNKEFMRYTFWSQHLILHTAESLQLLCKNAGYQEVSIIFMQRYPLSNHINWIINGEPGGYKSKFSVLDDDSLSNSYSNSLAKIGLSDTLLAFCKA